MINEFIGVTFDSDNNMKLSIFFLISLVLLLSACGRENDALPSYTPMPCNSSYDNNHHESADPSYEPTVTLPPSPEIPICSIMQAAENLLVTMPTIFSLGFGADSGALFSYAPANVIGWYWYDRYGERIDERVGFLRDGLVPRSFMLLDLDGNGVPSIFVIYEGLHIDSSVGILFRYYSGEFREVHRVPPFTWVDDFMTWRSISTYLFLSTDRFYKSEQGSIILRVDDDDYGLHAYLLISFDGYHMETHYIVPGQPLTPIASMMAIEEDLTAMVRTRLGIADASPLAPAPDFVQTWPVWDAPAPECDDPLAHALHAAKVFLSDHLTIFGQGLFYSIELQGGHSVWTTRWVDTRGNAIPIPPGVSISAGDDGVDATARFAMHDLDGDGIPEIMLFSFRAEQRGRGRGERIAPLFRFWDGAYQQVNSNRLFIGMHNFNDEALSSPTNLPGQAHFFTDREGRTVMLVYLTADDGFGQRVMPFGFYYLNFSGYVLEFEPIHPHYYVFYYGEDDETGQFFTRYYKVCVETGYCTPTEESNRTIMQVAHHICESDMRVFLQNPTIMGNPQEPLTLLPGMTELEAYVFAAMRSWLGLY